jgi:hypothetical protein
MSGLIIFGHMKKKKKKKKKKSRFVISARQKFM